MLPFLLYLMNMSFCWKWQCFICSTRPQMVCTWQIILVFDVVCWVFDWKYRVLNFSDALNACSSSKMVLTTTWPVLISANETSTIFTLPDGLRVWNLVSRGQMFDASGHWSRRARRTSFITEVVHLKSRCARSRRMLGALAIKPWGASGKVERSKRFPSRQKVM